jgi:hypothetical protein
MRKLFALLLIPVLFLGSRASFAQIGAVSPQGLESFIRRMCPMYNIHNGSSLEYRFRITEFRDGKWTCDDRAELAKRIAGAYGYEASYGIDKTSNPKLFHRYIVVLDKDGNKHYILRSRLRPTED